MSIALVMIAKDEEAVIRHCLDVVTPLISEWRILDTGSTDRTQAITAEWARATRMPGAFAHGAWVDFGQARTHVLEMARMNTSADWLLMLDADMEVEFHPDFVEWLASDPDPSVNAWQVEVIEAGTSWRLPLLTRRSAGGRYVGAAHEHLEIEGEQRQVTGLVVHHHPTKDAEGFRAKLDRDLLLLRPGVEDGDARATFYAAECLRFLGRDQEAKAMYVRRAGMEGFEEERWYATYQSAALARDPHALIGAWLLRPWRHEPLTLAAQIVQQVEHNDVLFRELVRHTL